MPTERIGDAPAPPCQHPEHHPPMHMVLRPGRYRHICPRCGAMQYFTVQPVRHGQPITNGPRVWKGGRALPTRFAEAVFPGVRGG